MKDDIKEAKSQYKARMKQAMGENWRRISRKLGIHNPTFKEHEVNLIKNYLKK